MRPEERGRDRAAQEIAKANAKPLRAAEDEVERAARARRREETLERLRALGVLERPNTTWEVDE